MDIKKSLNKLQNLSENKKKIILWSIVAILGIIMIFFWLKTLGGRIKTISQNGFMEQLNLPSAEEVIKKGTE